MAEEIVIDANIISIFIKEELGIKGDVHFIITALYNKDGFAINKIIENEWRMTAGNDFFKYWFDNALRSEKIHYISDVKKISTSEKKVISQKYGFPLSGSHDIHYIICAINTEKKYIYTDDLDFYDPKHKMSHHKVKEKIKSDRTGRFCKYLKEKFDVTIGRTEHCFCDLGISR